MKHLTNDELNRLVDNELSQQEKIVVEQHLSECSFCSDELKSFKSLNSLLLEQNVEEAPNGIEYLIMKKIARKMRSDKSQKTFFRFIVSLFSLGITAIIGFVGYRASKTIFQVSVNSEMAQWFNQTSAQIKSIIDLAFGEKTLRSFEVTMLLFFILSIYFLVEKYKAIRH
jgi:anti-sigma factor RsiW